MPGTWQARHPGHASFIRTSCLNRARGKAQAGSSQQPRGWCNLPRQPHLPYESGRKVFTSAPFSMNLPVLRSGHPGTFIHVEGDQSPSGICSLAVTDSGRCYICAARDFFDALKAVRLILEARDVQVLCNGSREDVWPSAKSRRRDSGLVAYVCKPGQVATEEVQIFEDATDTSHVSVSTQEAYAKRWLASVAAR